MNSAVATALATLDCAASDRALATGGTVIAPLASVATLISTCIGKDKPEAGNSLVVVLTAHNGEDLLDELTALASKKRVYLFPSWETLPHERLSPQSDTVAQRFATLRAIRNGECDIVVLPVRSFIQPFMKDFGRIEVPFFIASNQMEMNSAIKNLLQLGYNRTDLVEKRGEFAQRGGIIDLFPPQALHPIRVEFFDDIIDEVRYFSVADQRSLELCSEGLLALPAREILITEEIRKRAAQLAVQESPLAEMFFRISEGIPIEGMESLMPALTHKMESFSDVIKPGTRIIAIAPELIRNRASELIRTGAEFLEASWLNATAGNKIPIDLGEFQRFSFLDLDTEIEQATERGCIFSAIAPFGGGAEAVDSSIRATEPFRGNSERFITFLREKIDQQWSILVTTLGHGTAIRYEELLRGEGIPIGNSLQPGAVLIANSPLRHGFTFDAQRFCLITERDFAGSKAQDGEKVALAARRKNRIDPLTLKEGDFVVHQIHGIGKFIEMVERVVKGTKREYLVIEYASSKRGQARDRLYLPTDSLDQVSKYVGGESPTVHHMGGADWQKAKGKARKAVRQIAAELIQLYAARTSSPGFAFSADTPWQRELEDAFAYVETADQLVTISEVKKDMEASYPMDRIVCGDVGFGKTEIAIRAAFKAVQDGKQVAVLVPTTLLVQQHLTTFSERFAGFPVKLSGLSRFATASEIKNTLTELESGKVDVVIGTHRLLSSDVHFNDLGLVIIDEEQRFGVEHKEKLKRFRAYVDVLAMSATPIPRTLEMSITGIREMSIMATPPEERHPVLTYVGGFEERQIVAAIRRELLRDGQIFYIHNRVNSIDRCALRLAEIVPEARIRIAHGQMSENALEAVILAFWQREFDILVCTTIIESGIDIPNSNTLIVEQSDKMGLSQLHQLRGRVGRGRERGYAYFLYDTEKPLTEAAHDRLETIAANSELGSGMQVALKDLEIRGAGNLLGGEQSGHIADVGFDLYMRMIGEAVADFKGEKHQEQECKLELPIDAFLPHDYVDSERVRLDIYRRLAGASSVENVDEVDQELVDRFGTYPEPVASLLKIAKLRVRVKELNLTEVIVHGKHLRLSPIRLGDSLAVRMVRLYPGHIYKPSLSTLLLPLPARIGAAFEREKLGDNSLLEWVAQALESTTREGKN
jgi:transcription-repair coupling factor (superfamily II helicase)